MAITRYNLKRGPPFYSFVIFFLLFRLYLFALSGWACASPPLTNSIMCGFGIIRNKKQPLLIKWPWHIVIWLGLVQDHDSLAALGFCILQFSFFVLFLCCCCCCIFSTIQVTSKHGFFKLSLPSLTLGRLRFTTCYWLNHSIWPEREVFNNLYMTAKKTSLQRYILYTVV